MRPLAEDLFSEAFNADPHAYWSRLRARAPVAWSQQLSAWLITAHAPAVSVLNSCDFETDIYGRFRPSPVPIASSFELGREENVQFRKLIGRVMQAELRSQAAGDGHISRTASSLKQQIPRNTTFDFVVDYAEPLAEWLARDWLGISDLRRAEILAQLDMATNDRDARRRAAASKLAVDGLLAEIAERRVNPSNDLLGRLSIAWEEADARDLDLAAFISPLLFSLVQRIGTRLLTHAVLAAGSDTRIQGAVRAGGYSVAREVALEAARWEPINRITPRRASRVTDLAGQTIHEGDTVLIVLTAVCRDPAVHDSPTEFLLNRGEHSLAFGRGPHGCLGRELALLVTGTALIELVDGTQLLPAPRAEPDFEVGFGRGCTKLPMILRPLKEQGTSPTTYRERREVMAQ